MDNRVVVHRYNGELEREVWAFIYLTGYGRCGAVLDRWMRETRATKRHKFKSERRDTWARLGRSYESGAKRPDIPDAVATEALAMFRASVRMADEP